MYIWFRCCYQSPLLLHFNRFVFFWCQEVLQRDDSTIYYDSMRSWHVSFNSSSKTTFLSIFYFRSCRQKAAASVSNDCLQIGSKAPIRKEWLRKSVSARKRGNDRTKLKYLTISSSVVLECAQSHRTVPLSNEFSQYRSITKT